MAVSTFPNDAEREALWRVESTHHMHGHTCTCGFTSPVARQRTEHITQVILDALAPLVADRERAAAARALREAAEAAARVPDCALYLWLDDRAKGAALESE